MFQHAALVIIPDSNVIRDTRAPPVQLHVRVRHFGGLKVIIKQVRGIVIKRVQAVLQGGYIQTVTHVPEQVIMQVPIVRLPVRTDKLVRVRFRVIVRLSEVF